MSIFKKAHTKEAFIKFKAAAPEGAALALLIPLAIVAGLMLLQLNRQGESETKQPGEQAANSGLPQDIKGEAGEKVREIQKQVVRVNIEGAGKPAKYDVFLTPGESAAAVLMRMQELGWVSVKVKDFGGDMGLFIEEMNGVSNDQAGNKYWTLYVNGERSELGASSVKLQPGDEVAWRYEEISN